MENLLAIEHLNVDFALRNQVLRAVNDVSLDIMPGEVVGLVGDNGAGKSTIMRLLGTVLKPSSGTARVDRLYDAINDVEQRVREVAPIAKPMYIEPDIFRVQTEATPPADDHH